jgi:hypothetical protein
MMPPDRPPGRRPFHIGDLFRAELVQWPAGHADGITKADFA